MKGSPQKIKKNHMKGAGIILLYFDSNNSIFIIGSIIQTIIRGKKSTISLSFGST